MNLISQLYLDPGDAILVETPSFVHTSMIFKMFEATFVPCAMDDDGLIMEDVEAKIRQHHPKFIYTVPTFQNPTGVTMSLERRKTLARLAAEYDVTVIEDDPYREIQRAADCGAQGLIVPCLRTVDEYRRLVELAKFPPEGSRGFIKGRGCGFGNQPWAAGSLEDFMAASNDKLMVIPQCETAESLACIEEIAALPGVDGIFIGPFDLSISMGIPGRFQDPAFTAAVDRIVTAFHQADKPAYIFTNTPAESRARLAAGIDGVANSLNSIVLVEAYRKIVADIRA